MEAIGRAAEVERVASSVFKGRRIAVIGEPGIGKSVVAKAAAPDAAIGQGVSLLATEPWFALNRAVGAVPRAGGPEAVASRVMAALDGRTLLIDDLQWVDPATVEVLQFMTDVVATARPEAQGLAEQLGFECVVLTPLADDAAASLARAVNADADVEAIVAFALGNPLAITTAARDGVGAMADVVAQRLSSLTDDARLDAVRAAIATDVFEGSASELDPVGLLTPHALVADAVLAAVPEGVLREAHQWWADRGGNPSTRARHLIAAGSASAALQVALDGAAIATELEDKAECLAIATSLDDDDARLRHEAGWTLFRVRRFDEAVPLLRRFEVATDPEELVLTMLQTLEALEAAGDLVGLTSVIEALPATPLLSWADPEARLLGVRLLIAASNVAIHSNADRAEAMAAAERAWAAARQTGIQVAHAGRTLGLILGEDRRQGWREVLEEALEAATEPEERLTLMNVIAAIAPRNGEYDLAATMASRMGDEARAAEQLTWIKVATYHESSLALRSGRLAEVAPPIVAVRDLPGPRLLQIQLEALAAEGRSFAGEDCATELRAVIATGPADNPMVSELDAAVGWVELWSGDIARAEAAAQAALLAARTAPEIDGAEVLRAWVGFEADEATKAERAVSDPLLAREVSALESRDGDRLRAVSDEWRPSDVVGALRTAYAAAEADRRAGHDAADLFRKVLADADDMGAGAIAQRCRAALRKMRAAGFGGAESAVADGGLLTVREAEVLGLVADGLTDAAIAQRLFLSRSTVSATIRRAAAKLGVAGRARAAAAFRS